MVIRGWDEGITYFNKGSEGTLYIPSSLGYGPSGAGGAIPPNAILIFEIQVLDSWRDKLGARKSNTRSRSGKPGTRHGKFNTRHASTRPVAARRGASLAYARIVAEAV